MTDTAILLSAQGSNKIHAHKPDSDQTLCGMQVIDPEDFEPGDYPNRSADWTGRRYYIGLQRLMCERCTREAMRVRVVAEGRVSFPLASVRAIS